MLRRIKMHALKFVSAIALALAVFACGFTPLRTPSAPYTVTLSQWSGPHYTRAGEFIGRSASQPPTTNLSALVPFVCQHDTVIDRVDVWGQVGGPYAVTVWHAPRATFLAPPSPPTPPAYVATSMTVTVPVSSNVAETEDGAIYCPKGDFLLTRFDNDVNPEHIIVYARASHWNP